MPIEEHWYVLTICGTTEDEPEEKLYYSYNLKLENTDEDYLRRRALEEFEFDIDHDDLNIQGISVVRCDTLQYK